MHELLTKVNWVDIFVLILLLRISYVSSQIGVGIQLLPLVLLVLIMCIALYNYAGIASFFVNRLSMAPSTCNFFSYTLIMIVFSAIYRFALRLTGVVLAMGETVVSGIEKIGGMILGVMRSVVIIGLVLIGFLLTPIKTVEDSVKHSASGIFFLDANLNVYSFTMNLLFGNNKVSIRNTRTLLVSPKKNYILKKIDMRDKSRYYKESY